MIPAIDLAPFLSSRDREAVVRGTFGWHANRSALSSSAGTVCRSNCSPAPSHSRCPFFALPPEVKRRSTCGVARQQRGYHGLATRNLGRTLSADVPPDLRESFFLGPIDDHRTHYAFIPEAAASYAPNILPAQPAGFAATMIELYRGFECLSRTCCACSRWRSRCRRRGSPTRSAAISASCPATTTRRC